MTSRFLHTTILEKIYVSRARDVKGREDTESIRVCESGLCGVLWYDWRDWQRRFTLQMSSVSPCVLRCGVLYPVVWLARFTRLSPVLLDGILN